MDFWVRCNWFWVRCNWSWKPVYFSNNPFLQNVGGLDRNRLSDIFIWIHKTPKSLGICASFAPLLHGDSISERKLANTVFWSSNRLFRSEIVCLWFCCCESAGVPNEYCFYDIIANRKTRIRDSKSSTFWRIGYPRLLDVFRRNHNVFLSISDQEQNFEIGAGISSDTAKERCRQVHGISLNKNGHY